MHKNVFLKIGNRTPREEWRQIDFLRDQTLAELLVNNLINVETSQLE